MNSDGQGAGREPLVDLGQGGLARLVARGKNRGFISAEQLKAALQHDQTSPERIEDIMAAISNMGIEIVQYEDLEEDPDTDAGGEGGKDGPKVPACNEDTDPTSRQALDTGSSDWAGRSDDPVRLYLREMGAAEMLSREGEAAISKRIEAGRDMMILGLCESPITFHAIIEWSEALNNGELQLREILDLDAMLSKEPAPESLSEDGESGDDGEIGEKAAIRSFKDEDEDEVEEESGDEVDEDGNPIPKREAEEEEEDNTLSLAQMEAALKPEALEKFMLITELFQAFERLQSERLGALALGIDFPAAKEDQYQQLREDLTAQVESVKFHATKIEYLVDNLYAFNRRLTTLGGQMLRLAERHKVKRADFLHAYAGNEVNETWLTNMAKKDKKWAAFAEAEADPVERIRAEVSNIAAATGMAAYRVPPHCQHGPERRARGAHRQEGDGRGEPAPGDLDRQKVHEPRPSVSGSHPGRQHRPDEGGRQVRVPPRVQVFDLCHLVDQAIDHALDRGPGPHDPHPGPHDRDDQQAGPIRPPVPSRAGPRGNP